MLLCNRSDACGVLQITPPAYRERPMSLPDASLADRLQQLRAEHFADAIGKVDRELADSERNRDHLQLRG